MGENRVSVEFDQEADILYIRIKESRVEDRKPLSDDVYADLDERGDIISIEIWRASQLAIPPIAKALAESIRKLTTIPT
ncbi:MAG: DUF2283 domain-containing protein [Candidatus Geothermarchaeales archaeon]